MVRGSWSTTGTLGPYDVVAIVEAPDDESVTAVFREIGTAGNARPTMLRAFDREEMLRIIERLVPSPGT